MNGRRSILLGSAAGLTAVAGAQAADLPVKKAVAVEYVRVCTAYGAGFFYIPGTDTCLRVTGVSQAAYQYSTDRGARAETTGYRAMGRIALDARTETAYGTLRTFVRMDMRNQSGEFLHSGTSVRMAVAFTGTGVDTAGRLQTYVDLDKAFIQFAGFTAGRASSFFDFYAQANEIIGSSFSSVVSATNLVAYTAMFGGGFSATISVEDPTWRRQPVYTPFNAVGGQTGLTIGASGAGTVVGNALTSLFGNGAVLSGGGVAAVTPVPTAFDAAGNPVAYQLLDIAQRNRVPDFVGNLRLDQPWGSAQLSVATHEIFTGTYQTGLYSTGLVPAGSAVPGIPGAVSGAANTAIAVPAGSIGNTFNKVPDAKYGYAIQGGVKINLPMIAAGDVLYLQAAYAMGALRYTCVHCWNGSEAVSIPIGGRFNVNSNDAVVGPNGQLSLSDSWSAVASFKHFWTPTVSSAITLSVGEINYPGIARAGGPANLAFFPAFTAMQFNALAFNASLKDAFLWQVAANVNWTPVRGLDLGVEAVYTKARLTGLTADASKFGTTGAVLGVPLSVTRDDEYFMSRLRIQREF